EQEFIYERPIVAGDVLRCQNQLVDIFEREGKQGMMTFFILETRGEDRDGNLVFRSRTTVIYR
ncbi:MAG TPA: MaoC family dehydratase, partial [Clostridiales bacterium]|nr:MaoC family dehydratase [Clostridiales bacterium]